LHGKRSGERQLGPHVRKKSAGDGLMGEKQSEGGLTAEGTFFRTTTARRLEKERLVMIPVSVLLHGR